MVKKETVTPAGGGSLKAALAKIMPAEKADMIADRTEKSQAAELLARMKQAGKV